MTAPLLFAPDLAPALRPNSTPVGVWNAFEIRAFGTSITVRLNGLDIANLQNASRRRAGHIALRLITPDRRCGFAI